MRASEFLHEARSNPEQNPKLTIRDQVLADVKHSGGNPQDYFIRFTRVERLGFSNKQEFGRFKDVSNLPNQAQELYDPTDLGSRHQGRRALWFYPLSEFLKNRGRYAEDMPYIWLVRIKPDAWLQPLDPKSVATASKQGLPAPKGKHKVGLYKPESLGADPQAIFFEPAFDLIGMYKNFPALHQRHGQVLGPAAGKSSVTPINKFKNFISKAFK